MGAPAESFLGDVEVERWLGPGMSGAAAALDPSAPPLATPAPAGLSSAAGPALDFLLRAPGVNQDFACRRLMILSSFPFHPVYGDPDEGVETEARISSALQPARLMSGRNDKGEIDRGLMHRLLGVPRDRASPAFLGQVLLSLTESLQRLRDEQVRKAVRETYLSLKQRTVEKWDMAFFTGGGRRDFGAPGSVSPGRMSDGSAAAAILAFGRLTDNEGAVELARKLARGIASGRPEAGGGVREDGSFSGETHPCLQDACAAAEIGLTFGERELLLWAQRVYDFVRERGADSGFFPREILPEAELPRAAGPPGAAAQSPSAAPIGDTCATACMTRLAILLARARSGDYYDHAERYVRNHLARMQFLPPPGFADWYRARHRAHPHEQVEAALSAVLADCPGGFLSHTAPNDLCLPDAELPPLAMASCCTAEAVRALAAAWRFGVTEAEGTVDVHMRLGAHTDFVTVSAPQEGRLMVSTQKPCGLRVRPPVWTDRSGITVQRSGSPAMFSFDGSYVCLEDLRAGESVVFRWPVPMFTQRHSLIAPGAVPAVYQWRWEGGRIAGVSPRGTALPLP